MCIWSRSAKAGELCGSGHRSRPFEQRIGTGEGLIVPQSFDDLLQSGYHFKVSGMSKQNCVLEYSLDLISWWALQTNRLAASEMEIADADAASADHRFYRARAVP